MLSQLYIENLAVIKQTEINLKQGFNVFTGETGAGKTILVTAINAILGAKLSKDIVRTGETKAIIIATFENLDKNVIKIAAELGYDISENLLISREISVEGKSTCRVNGKPANLSIIKEITEHIVDVHGQQDSSRLVSADKQLALIDAYGDYTADLQDYLNIYNEMRSINKQINDLTLSEADKAQKIDILSYQIEEINSAALEIGEEEELEKRKKILDNSHQIIRDLSEADSFLNSDIELPEQINSLSDILIKLEQYLPELENASEKCREYYYELKEIGTIIRQRFESFEYNQNEIDDIENRLHVIYNLKRKYGKTIKEILEFGCRAEVELDEITLSGEKLEILLKKQKSNLEQITVKSKTITSLRKASANKFTKLVESELKFLDMSSVKLTIEFETCDFTQNGTDKLQILISVNPGEPPKPISKIASGGEISRIMLAIKNVIAGKDNINSMIFDEIDTGVSGKAADKIGKKLKECSTQRQLICVTHLAQVAAYSDQHFRIEKSIVNNRTFTNVVPLDKEQRIIEIARIMVGEHISDAAISSAKELVNNSQKI